MVQCLRDDAQILFALAAGVVHVPRSAAIALAHEPVLHVHERAARLLYTRTMLFVLLDHAGGNA
jgi:hypothetical protein